jgi:hypothetical protein
MDKSIKPTPHNRSILPVLRIELRFLGLPTRGVASSSDSLELQSCSACMLDPSSDAASVAVCYCKVQQQVWNGNKENSVGRACRATSIRFMRNCPHYSLASRGRGGGAGQWKKNSRLHVRDNNDAHKWRRFLKMISSFIQERHTYALTVRDILWGW